MFTICETLCQDPKLGHIMPHQLHYVGMLVSIFKMRTEGVSDAVVCAPNY